MNEIHILDNNTVDQIAAGEVVERPSSVVKELLENAVDAGAKHITVEIKEGGISFIRVTDDGSGIEESQLSKVFMRHATSKIVTAADLESVMSLGFRGEALSSIAAVCQVELITKTKDALTGRRVCINGGEIETVEEIGAPPGTTILVRNIFFNTPVRRKFLKTAATEGSYIADFMQHMAMSVPDVAFQFIANGQTRFYTSGNGKLDEIIYRLYGKEAAVSMIPIEAVTEGCKITGFLGKPVLNRSNRSYEIFFVNKRYIKSSLISSAVEEGYHTFLMQHKYPFVILHFEIDPAKIDVNVHPTKMEIRINEPARFLEFIKETVREGLKKRPLVPSMEASKPFVKEEDRQAEKKLTAVIPQPFEQNRRAVYEKPEEWNKLLVQETSSYTADVPAPSLKQMELFSEEDIRKQELDSFRILGQVFDTYWILALSDKIYYVDQHAAHEKVMYERLMKQYREKEIAVQTLNPPLVITLNPKERNILLKHFAEFSALGFELDEFGEDTYAIRSVPTDLYGVTEKELFLSILDEMVDSPIKGDSEVILSKIAGMSCKAAVKGNQTLSEKEARLLMKELLACDNPFNCPHGRPTIISMTRQEMERKFKRLV